MKIQISPLRFSRRALQLGALSLTLGLGCTLSAPPAAAQNIAPVQWSGSLESALAESKRTGKLVMVDFYTDWCGW